MSTTVLIAGHEREPVVVVENALPDPFALVTEAAAARFERIGPFYPGPRAPVSRPTIAAAVRVAAAPLTCEFGADGVDVIDAFYSLVADAPSMLTLPQRIPHYDGVERERIALLVYLCDPHFGGTAFYRHRPTGYETISRERLQPYLASVRADFRSALPAPAYVGQDDPVYDRTLEVAGRLNRMLLYRGNILHSADVANAKILSPDPRVGRLTLNLFMILKKTGRGAA